MDHPSLQSVPSIEEDEWDTDGYVIPSLIVGESGHSITDVPDASDLNTASPNVSFDTSVQQAVKVEENIYLGPHGAPPSQAKQQELNFGGRKQRFKQKLKEADKKFPGSGRENKVESLRELVGSKSGAATMPKNSPRDWLDPHCHESQFERYSN